MLKVNLKCDKKKYLARCPVNTPSRSFLIRVISLPAVSLSRIVELPILVRATSLMRLSYLLPRRQHAAAAPRVGITAANCCGTAVRSLPVYASLPARVQSASSSIAISQRQIVSNREQGLQQRHRLNVQQRWPRELSATCEHICCVQRWSRLNSCCWCLRQTRPSLG